MKTNGKSKTIIYEDLMLRIFTGKFCDYMYRSPRYGYKHAHKYDKVVYIYLNGHFDDGYFETLYFKQMPNERIIARMAEFKKTSRQYKKAINTL